MKAIINENFLKETIAKSIRKVLSEIDWKTYANARDKQQVHKKRDWDRKAAFNDMSAERFLDDYGYGDETGKISANKFRTNGYNYDFNPTMVNNQGIEFGNPEYFISNKNDYYLKNHEPGKWYVGTQYEDGDEVYPRMVSPNFDTYEEAVRFANDNGLSYDTGLPSEKLKSAYDKAKKEFHDFRTSYYVAHPYDKESNYEYDNQKGWHLKDTK